MKKSRLMLGRNVRMLKIFGAPKFIQPIKIWFKQRGWKNKSNQEVIALIDPI